MEDQLSIDSPAPEPALTKREHRRLAHVLIKAAHERQAIVPLSARFPELTTADAARIRDMTIVARIEQGEQLIGAKVSLGRSALGRVATDDARLGWLTDGMLAVAPDVDLSPFIHPRVEAKVAFLLARPLRRRVATIGELLALTSQVLPCLEIVDGRYHGTDLGRVDHIADNCAAAKLLIGNGIPVPPEEQLLRVRVHLDAEPSSNGARPRPVERISPVEATLWLANRVIEESGELEPGAFLVSSACCHPVELRPGIRVRAEFTGLGRLELETVSSPAAERRSADQAC